MLGNNSYMFQDQGAIVRGLLKRGIINTCTWVLVAPALSTSSIVIVIHK
jgi:hypothetical protein